MNDAVIEAHWLRCTLGDRQVLRDVSLRVGAGETLGLVGRNGAGKTTLLRCLLGLAFPQGGEARVFGESATDMSPRAKARLGYVAQNADLPAMHTGEQLLALIAEWQPRWDAVWAAQLVERLAVPLQTRTEKMSAGELQLLALVLALGHRPDLLVLDEPVAALDPVVRRAVAAILAELQAERGTSIVFSTHILSDLERLATHVAVLEDGVLGLQREVDALKQDVVLCRIERQTPLPSMLQCAGVLSWRLSGHGAANALVDTTQLPLEHLRDEFGAAIKARRVNMEEFVVEYLR
ncbi:MAG: ABC transporter ATP-binding protein [Moraxellaceae bacterium]|nr:ABC transporter ATP-binding protein [Moraxellaceae bacterium]